MTARCSRIRLESPSIAGRSQKLLTQCCLLDMKLLWVFNKRHRVLTYSLITRIVFRPLEIAILAMTNSEPEQQKDNPQQQESTQQQEKSPLDRREARNKRVEKIIKYLGFSGSGAGGFGAIGLLLAGNYQAALVSGSLTIVAIFLAIAYRFLSGVINLVLDKIEEELENVEEPLATWIVKQFKNSVIGFWWALNPKFQRDYYHSLVDLFRELKIEGFRIGLPVLDLENVFVPLLVDPEVPDNIPGAMIPANSDLGSQQIWDFLAQSTKKNFKLIAV